MEHSCKVIAICNQKGGVGKTTTTQALSAALVEMGYKVLAIDADQQGSLTKAFGWDRNTLKITFGDKMSAIIQDQEGNELDGILHHKEEGVDVLPSNIRQATLEMELFQTISREHILAQYIDIIREHYDFILIDCSPSLGMVTLNALTAADSLLIPVETANLAIEGLEDLLRTVYKVRKSLNKKLKIEGILFTCVDAQTNDAKTNMNDVVQRFGDYVSVFNTVIPDTVKVKEAARHGVSIIHYKQSNEQAAAVSAAYRRIAKEVSVNE